MDSQLTLFVLGGTGRTGKAVIKTALKAGHKIRALTRNPDKAPKFEEGEVEWIKGSGTERDLLVNSMKGCDAVLSALGPNGLGKTTLYSDSVKIIYDAMK
mmetsp:Transcript_26350/g.23266  ORF Transcript_26350/g.23266 Transcript_26350/m.23266 type:complete len:100 (+) Transcript_26350:36-335(+)